MAVIVLLLKRVGEAGTDRELRFIGVFCVNTMWTGDADLRLYITTVQDG